MIKLCRNIVGKSRFFKKTHYRALLPLEAGLICRDDDGIVDSHSDFNQYSFQDERQTCPEPSFVNGKKQETHIRTFKNSFGDSSTFIMLWGYAFSVQVGATSKIPGYLSNIGHKYYVPAA